MKTRIHIAPLAAIVFVSGFCSLVYQVTWLRSLRLVFGSSTPATAVVLAIFMGGLGLGGWYFGRRVEGSSRPLAFYARIEMGIAFSAAASLLLVPLAREVYLAVGGSAVLGLGGATFVRLLLAVLVLGLPTTLMGGTLPAVAQAVERRRDVGRRIVATFYGVNTLGAVAGAFASTFFFLELFGVSRSLLLAALVNLLLALVLRAWAREIYATDGEPAAEAETTVSAAPAAPDAYPTRQPAAAAPAGLLLAVAGLVGFLFFLMEIVWYRMLAPLLGGSSYTFGLILTLALAGIGLGGWLYSLGGEDRRPTLHGLAASLALEAFFLAVPLALGDRLVVLVGVLRDLQAGGFWALVLAWTISGGLVVLPPALVAGYQFPLLVGLLGRGREHVGSEVGRAYAWNTWGAVLGSLLGGLVLLPRVGAILSWRLSVLVLLAGAVAVAWTARAAGKMPDGAGRSGRSVAACGVLVLLTVPLAFAEGPSAFWRHQPWGAGRAEVTAEGPNELRRAVHQSRRSVLAEADGVESSVALLAADDLTLVVNGKADGSARSDAPMQVMGGLIGAALHPAPKNVLVVGLGTGMTAGWLAAVPEVEHVDVVELEPAVVRFSEEFRSAHLGVLESPKVELHIGDGREWIRTTDRRYDIVFSEPSNPYRAGVPDLFSREFYAAVAERLAPGGIFIHWLQGYEVDAEVVRIVYSTLGDVFPRVESWQPHAGDLLLLASAERPETDFDAVRRRVEREPYRSAMRGVWGVEGEEGFYTAYLGGESLADALAAGSDRISTDDHPLLEFAFARNLGRVGLFRLESLRKMAVRRMAEHPRGRGRPPSWRDVEELRGVRAAAGSLSLRDDELRGRPGFSARQEARRAFVDDRWAAAAAAWHRQDEAPRALFDRVVVAAATSVVAAGSAFGEVDEGEERIAALLPDRPAERDLLRAVHLAEAGRPEEAFRAFLAGLENARAEPWLDRRVSRKSIDRVTDLVGGLADGGDPEARELVSEVYAALDEELPGRLLRDRRSFARLKIVYALPPGARTELCVGAFAGFEPHVPWNRTFLEQRLACYEEVGDPRARRAREDLWWYLRRAPARLTGDGGWEPGGFGGPDHDILLRDP